ncbi:hypothetical protein V6615_14545 [Oscillospiraceae bacterium PP1C4]
MSEAMEPLGTEDQISFSYHTKVEDLLQATEVIDKKNRSDMRRNVQSMGIVIVLWMFVPDVMENPTRIVSWLMIALALGMMFMLWKYPDYENKKFASKKAELSPDYDLTVTREGIDVVDGSAHGVVSFSGRIAVFEYKNVFAITFEKNRVMAIPKDQLEEQTVEKLRGLLCQGLGDRFEKVDEFTKQAGLFGRGR